MSLLHKQKKSNQIMNKVFKTSWLSRPHLIIYTVTFKQAETFWWEKYGLQPRNRILILHLFCSNWEHIDEKLRVPLFAKVMKKSHEIPWKANCVAKTWDDPSQRWNMPTSDLTHYELSPTVFAMHENGQISL